MSTNAILRRTIKALCAPAVMATLAWHAPVAQAEVNARSASYSYDSSPGSSSGVTTFTFSVLENEVQNSEVSGPLVTGSPHPFQLTDAQLDPQRSNVFPTISRLHNCITVTLPTQSGSSGSSSFSITYTVTDGARVNPQSDTATLTFNDFGQETFSRSNSARCSDELFDEIAATRPQPDNASTDANTPIGIPVIANDNPSYDNPVVQVGPRSDKGATLQANQDGSITYIPARGFSGTDTFVYTVQDYAQKGFEDLNPRATVTVVVTEPVPEPAVIALVQTDGGLKIIENSESIPDTDDTAGETVTFDGSQTIVQDRRPTNFQWFVGISETPQQQGSSPVFTSKLPDGDSQVRLVATIDIGEGGPIITASSTVSVSVDAPDAPPQPDVAVIVVNNTPVANGNNFDIADTDQTVGETATFDGSRTILADGVQPNRFQWFVNGESAQDGESPTFQTKLNDGLSQVQLIATANDGESEFARATSTININVAAAVVTPSQATIVVNGTPVKDGTFSLTDTNGKPGEDAVFDGSQSMLVGGVRPTRFQWFVNGTQQQDSDSPTFKFTLSDGSAQVRLLASAGEVSAESLVSVSVGAVATLANIPGLTANQRSVAMALDNICTTLQQQLAAQQTLTPDQDDLRQRCEGILAADAASQRRALDELGAQDFNGARLQTLLFTNSLYAGVQDRLMALRGGAKGLSLAGLNIMIDGKPVPLAELTQMAGQLLGGGAAADDEPGSLLGDKWGAWSRGNFTFGDKDRSRNDNGFEADQFSLTAGLDYRLTDKMVLGGALAYGSSNLDYNPSKEGGLDTTSWAVSIYGSSYAGKNFYVDAVINAANSSYEADRRISYNEMVNGAQNTVQRQAKGDTDGLTLSGGLSGGYDFIVKGLTISPAVGVFYVDSTIDAFREKGAQGISGLNLVYDEQSFQSLTGTLGFRVNYAWNLSWGVLIPYFRGDYVREFNQDVEAFNVHFANDPKSPANTIIVKSDDPDESYVRLVGGISGQFPFGISGYVEYQRLQGFEFVNFNDLSMGLRVQYRY